VLIILCGVVEDHEPHEITIKFPGFCDGRTACGTVVHEPHEALVFSMARCPGMENSRIPQAVRMKED